MRRAFKRTVRDSDRDEATVRVPMGSRFVFVRVTFARFGGATSAVALTPRQARLLAKNLLDAAKHLKAAP